MKLNASIIGGTVAAKRGSSSTYAHRVAARLEPGAVVSFSDGSRVRVMQTNSSSDGLRMRVATAAGPRILSARQFVEMGPVSKAMTRLAAFVRLSFEAGLDDYVKEAIKAAGLPVDQAMNWSKYLERMYTPYLKHISNDVSLQDDAVRNMIVHELFEKQMLSSDSVHAHFNPNHPNFEGKQLDQKVTAYLISLFKFQKQRVGIALRRSLGAGMRGEQGLRETEGMDVSSDEGETLNDAADLAKLKVDKGGESPDIAEMEGNNEVSQFLDAFKEHINETQTEYSAQVLNFISDGFEKGMDRQELRNAIIGSTKFKSRGGEPLDKNAYQYIMKRWGQFIRAFAKDPESGWSDSPVARLIGNMADKEEMPVMSSLHLAAGVQEEQEMEEELLDKLEKVQLPPAAVKPTNPNVAQQEAVAENPKTPTLENGVDPKKPKLTIPPEIPGVNHTASSEEFEEKDMTTIDRLMAHERRASMAAPKAAAPDESPAESISLTLGRALTRYDAKQQGKRSYNPYALNLYLEAAERVEEAVNAGTPLRKALTDNFNDRLLDVVLKAMGQEKASLNEIRGITAAKFASLRRIAEQEPQEVAAAINDLSDSFTRMASQLAALKDNLDLAEAPKEASIRQKVAHRNRYGTTLRRLATEAPQELATAITEFYGQLDGLAGELENFADNIGVELGPTGDELGTEGEAPVLEEEEPLEDDFQAVPGEGEEGKIAGRKQAVRPTGPRIRMADVARKMVDSLYSEAEDQGVDLHGLTINNFNTFLDDAFNDGGETRCEHFTDIGWEYSSQFGPLESRGFEEAQWKVLAEAFRLIAKNDVSWGGEAPEGRTAGRKQASPDQQVIELLWGYMRKDPEHKDRVQTGWGTKTQQGLVATVKRFAAEDQSQLISGLWSSMRRDRENRDRVQTGWGTKTQEGLVASIKRIFRGSTDTESDAPAPEARMAGRKRVR